jgi:hypothetical protein
MGKLPNPRMEAYCRFYVLGHPARPESWLEDELTPAELASLPPQTMNNATQSLIAAGYSARGSSARSYASQLLTRKDVQSRIAELRDEKAELDHLARLRWSELVPAAQRALKRALRGDGATAVRAAKYIIDRAEGPVMRGVKGAGERENETGLPVLVLGFDDEPEPPVSFERRENGNDPRWSP